MTHTIDDLRAHVMAFVTDNDLDITWTKRMARGSMEGGFIETPVIKSTLSYATAMHELGHVLGSGQTGALMRAERGAWSWAKKNALVWTPAMSRQADRCLQWYKDNLPEQQRRRKVDRKAFFEQYKQYEPVGKPNR